MTSSPTPTPSIAARPPAHRPLESVRFFLPAGLFGPAYLARTAEDELRREWLRVRRLSTLAGAMVFPASMIALMILLEPRKVMPALMQPAVFWSVIIASAAIPIVAGAYWSRARRDQLQRLPRGSVGPGARLAFWLYYDPQRASRAAALFSLATGVGLGMLCVALLERYAWNFGPLLIVPITLAVLSLDLLIRGPQQWSGNPSRMTFSSSAGKG